MTTSRSTCVHRSGFPVVDDRVSLYPAVDVGLDQEAGRWQVQFATRIRLLGHRPMVYAGGAARFRKYDSSESSESDVVPVMLAGVSLPWRFLHPFAEVEVAAPTRAQSGRWAVVAGVSYRR